MPVLTDVRNHAMVEPVCWHMLVSAADLTRINKTLFLKNGNSDVPSCIEILTGRICIT